MWKFVSVIVHYNYEEKRRLTEHIRHKSKIRQFSVTYFMGSKFRPFSHHWHQLPTAFFSSAEKLPKNFQCVYSK